MELSDNPPCIIGTSCRLPGGVSTTAELWRVFEHGNWRASSTIPPPTRRLHVFRGVPNNPCRGGWLGQDGVECYDPGFFGIPRDDAETLRPNIRLALELTYEALENAGLPPQALRGKNVAISIGVGTEDGWDMSRWVTEGLRAFGPSWAASSDPSGVAGYVAHAFDFRGPCTTTSNACASGTFAIRDGINSLLHDDVDVAIVGSLATHFTPAPFMWAHSTGVSSPSGRCSSFSPDADGYSPSEGAVFLVFRRLDDAKASGDSIRGVIRSLVTGHNGRTRSLITPNAAAQADLSRKALHVANLTPDDISLIEAHATGTPIGDSLELEGIKSIYVPRKGRPLILSSSKTVFGHCHGSASLVGVLKVLACFQQGSVPPHGANPHPDLLDGSIIIPKHSTLLQSSPARAQINSFGFTGSIASLIVEQHDRNHTAVHRPHLSSDTTYYLLPFSGRTHTACRHQMQAVYTWASTTRCPLSVLAVILGLCRDHHACRVAVVAQSIEDIVACLGQDPDDAAPILEAPRDPRLTEALLSLETTTTTLFDDRFTPETLRCMIETDQLLNAARVLYRRGHLLAFASIYSKHEINPDLLSSFPLYHFDRTLYWYPLSDTSQQLQEQAPLAGPFTLTQTTFEELLAFYSSPIAVSRGASKSRPNDTQHILMTGASGTLGARVLHRLLKNTDLVVYCILRGDPLARLEESPGNFLHLDELHAAIARGRLVLFQTEDLSRSLLGLTAEEYGRLVTQVDAIIHLAWTVNFSLPLSAFIPLLQCTRTLAELCLQSNKTVRYHYIGSYASTFNYIDPTVPEEVLEPLMRYSLTQGYAVSKLIGEHMLLRLSDAEPYQFDLSIIRVGQICGDTTTGMWAQNEMMPMLIASMPVLFALPESMPEVSWIPSDVCSDALCEIVLAPRPVDASLGHHVFHLANPRLSSWLDIAHEMADLAGISSLRLLPWDEYIALVAEHASESDVPVARLLPYFLDSLEKNTMPSRYSSLTVSKTVQVAPSLASCPPVPVFLENIVRSTIAAHGRLSVAISDGHVFLFGPSIGTAAVQGGATEQRLRLKADLHGNHLSDEFCQQLATLAVQIDTAQDFVRRGILPRAVLGFCFGEYAAAITAGILTEDTVIKLLVNRAIAVEDVQGAMLAVFLPLKRVRRHLATFVDPPTIAILAGPSHVVLSGSRAQIEQAETILRRENVKTTLLKTSIPFHSSLMEHPCSTTAYVSYVPHDTMPVTYISGITGGPVPGSKVDFKYWMKHMSAPARFYQGMEYAREHFPGASFVDIGPGTVLSTIIARYQWADFKLSMPTDVRSPTTRAIPSAVTLELSDNPHAHDDSFVESDDSKDDKVVALTLLRKHFALTGPRSRLLHDSLHSLGMHSMDFIRFSSMFKARTGIDLPLSSFVTDDSLDDIIALGQSRRR